MQVKARDRPKAIRTGALNGKAETGTNERGGSSKRGAYLDMPDRVRQRGTRALFRVGGDRSAREGSPKEMGRILFRVKSGGSGASNRAKTGLKSGKAVETFDTGRPKRDK